VGNQGADTIDLAEAAERLGVHYQTAYRWVRSGRLPASLVEHRYRIHPDAVDDLAEERSRPKAPPRRRPRRGFGETADKVYDLLVDGDERATRLLVGRLVDDGVQVTTIAQEVLAPALRRIGEQWFIGRLSIPTEHRASAIVERVVGELLPNPRGRRRGIAVVAALSGDRHVLPTSFATIALREDNWHVEHLGADVPPDDVVRFCVDSGADLAVLTVTASEVRPDAERTAERLEAAAVRVIVGGTGDTLAELTRRARE
jgi:excisionase family DNA binding protein